MILVIQTTHGYDMPLAKLLHSVEAHKRQKSIIVVSNNEKVDSIGHENLIYDYEGISYMINIIVIRTHKNTWEYDSYAKMQYYIRTGNLTINKKLFLFLHDTCWVSDANEFWNSLDEISKNWDHTEKNKFYYPSIDGKFNIGICDKKFILEFGKQFENASFSKREGIKIEHGDERAKYKGVPLTAKYLLKGSKKMKRCGFKTPYSDLRRRVVYLPAIKLYKAFKPVFGRDVHPNIP